MERDFVGANHEEALKEATAWAQSYLLTGQVLSRGCGTFETLVGAFFDRDGEWAREKHPEEKGDLRGTAK